MRSVGSVFSLSSLRVSDKWQKELVVCGGWNCEGDYNEERERERETCIMYMSCRLL